MRNERRNRKGLLKMDKAKVTIQISLLEDGRIAVASTSNNHITNLGMLGVAQSMFLKGINEREKSSIVVPDIV